MLPGPFLPTAVDLTLLFVLPIVPLQPYFRLKLLSHRLLLLIVLRLPLLLYFLVRLPLQRRSLLSEHPLKLCAPALLPASTVLPNFLLPAQLPQILSLVHRLLLLLSLHSLPAGLTVRLSHLRLL